jgi:hypothetical protein
LAPDVAAAFFVTQFIEIGELLGRFGARVVGVVDDQATCCDAMIAQDDPYTGRLLPTSLRESPFSMAYSHPY